MDEEYGLQAVCLQVITTASRFPGNLWCLGNPTAWGFESDDLTQSSKAEFETGPYFIGISIQQQMTVWVSLSMSHNIQAWSFLIIIENFPVLKLSAANLKQVDILQIFQ